MFSLASRRPATWVANDIRRMDRLFNDVFAAFPFSDQLTREAESTAAWMPAVDVFETRDGLRIIAELPGVAPDQVKVSVEQGILTLRGEKQQHSEEQTEAVHRYERSYGAFQRSFQLPSSVDADRIDAKMEHGVLTISLPKAEKAKAKEIAVKSA
ncbi:MAG TPA: Hsp20/alpha crystallin family protein [Gemmatimonadales bacterium]|nr:Hsp20/alpha crystallin family protein [Gemmatimonadales bacterium]